MFSPGFAKLHWQYISAAACECIFFQLEACQNTPENYNGRE